MFCKNYIWVENDLLNPQKLESLHLDKYFSSYGLAKFLFLIKIRNGIFVIFLNRAETFLTDALPSHRDRHAGPSRRGMPRKHRGPHGRFDWGQSAGARQPTSARRPAVESATAPPILGSPEPIV